MTLAAVGSATTVADSMAQAKLDEKDPQAVALGYVADTTKADKKKYPKHEDAQQCVNCALYQGKPADAAGGCPLFAGKQVAKQGWCSAWAKKA
jgi:High potential iron-sulfur protein